MFKLRIFLPLLLLSSAAALADDTTAFGFKFGEPLTVDRCPKEYAFGRPTCWNKFNSDSNSLGDKDSVEMSFNADERPRIDGEYRFFINEGVLDGIEITTKGYGDQERNLSMLNRKYGKPTAYSEQKKMNRFGTEYVSFRATWDKPDISVQYISFLNDPSWGNLQIFTKARAERRDAALREAVKKGRDL